MVNVCVTSISARLHWMETLWPAGLTLGLLTYVFELPIERCLDSPKSMFRGVKTGLHFSCEGR
jgi:hypothetical protein